jgi:hypothetical protein
MADFSDSFENQRRRMESLSRIAPEYFESFEKLFLEALKPFKFSSN